MILMPLIWWYRPFVVLSHALAQLSMRQFRSTIAGDVPIPLGLLQCDNASTDMSVVFSTIVDAPESSVMEAEPRVPRFVEYRILLRRYRTRRFSKYSEIAYHVSRYAFYLDVVFLHRRICFGLQCRTGKARLVGG